MKLLGYNLIFSLRFLFLLLLSFPVSGAENHCIDCHNNKQVGQQAFHSIKCVMCHKGNASAKAQSDAHYQLINSPGHLSNASESCGQCHSEQTDSIKSHKMTTARSIVSSTRHALGQEDNGDDITQLGHSMADSLLRKLCASCHLGRETERASDPTMNRGGGCLACHLVNSTENKHAKLTTEISDAYCFGCHSRSGRISLNYAGLAETDSKEINPHTRQARLPDGRLVEILQPDIHHQAGMRCIDCHTGNELMRSASGPQCTDCHPLEISAGNHDQHHSRLTCDACHSQWAPLCYGCHINYTENEIQYDYLEGKGTPGKWQESRWMIQNDLPPLGVDAENQIRPFIPGMILTIEHPELENPIFKRLFAPLVPHTTGKSRSCASCHCNPIALGLGSGNLRKSESGWTFDPDAPLNTDNIPIDAWQSWDALGKGSSTHNAVRPLNKQEIHRILETNILCK